MRIHKEGHKILLVTILILGAICAVAYFFVPNQVAKVIIYSFCAIFFLLVLQFFRHPTRRKFNLDETTVISPADGKVVVIEEVQDDEYFKDRRLQVSVFMSPVNVHVNWFPVSGVVKYARYHEGKYLVAWHPKSSTDNERTTIVVEHPNHGPVMFRQIAGALARRIVYYCKEDDTAVQGTPFGFIKFGSRVDILLPLGTKVLVNLNEKVKGGKSIIASFE